MGEFPLELAATYSGLEHNFLCSAECSCEQINFKLWTQVEYSQFTTNFQDVEIDYSQKFFNGSMQNVIQCLDSVGSSMTTYNQNIVNYLTNVEQAY